MSRLERTAGARGVLVLLLIAQLLRMGVALGMELIVSKESLGRPEVYYALVILQEALMFGLPLFLFVRLLRPRYMPVLKAQMAFPPLGAAVRTVAAAVMGLVMFECYTVLWVMLLEGLGLRLWVPDIPLPGNGAQIILAMAAVVVLPAVLEELVFRGAVLEGLRRELSPRAALWLTALLFACMHGTMAALPVHIALGVLLTLMAWRRGSLQLPMLYHFVHNASSLILALYLRNWVQALGVDTQALGEAPGVPFLEALAALLPLTAAVTFAYALLVRPLLRSGPIEAPQGEEAPPRREVQGKGTVIALVAVLFLLMLPWYLRSMGTA